mgnify:CR=1 FL=1
MTDCNRHDQLFSHLIDGQTVRQTETAADVDRRKEKERKKDRKTQ